MNTTQRPIEKISRKLALGLLALSPFLFLGTLDTHASPAAKLGAYPGKPSAQKGYVSPWSLVREPSAGQTEVIGGAAYGCIAGASNLPDTGKGYVAIRRERNRHYGHPETLKLVKDMGAALSQRTDQLLMVGDMAQPRGGRMESMHRSHQNGMDVDIWFTLAPSPKAANILAPDGNDPPSMLDDSKRKLSSRFGDDQLFLLKTAAQRPNVDRIFVNFAIKNGLCQSIKGDRSWLNKVRPWWGHDAHFHVRLKCPAGSPECKQQPTVPQGDGCKNEVVSWMKKPVIILKKDDRPAPRPPLGPARCVALLKKGTTDGGVQTAAK
ncbi:MAG: penicillin-insensitive murein endopeptidase [Gammaproteobacteria bacterium]|nr:penicillin-insensitive murein endopeptidase [Gammaproteobacteria bacterium]MBU1654743.1 penicillin-insensitive murein endopeptidase [Gammaproteobacteria bacterium]MBU1961619.1 penicillin-insensitive murein endopeptidase [Gammaproteobacteria bacterium]